MLIKYGALFYANVTHLNSSQKAPFKGAVSTLFLKLRC